MKTFLVFMMALGAGLLGVILVQTDLGEVWRLLVSIGWLGFAAILGIYLACIVAQSASWLFTIREASPTPLWLYRLWKLMMVGFALEATTPFAGLGGEPVKAIILKRHYGIRVRDATASLVLTRTTDAIGQVIFIAIGFVLMLRTASLPGPYRIAAGAGLALFAAFIALFLLAQQQRTLGRIRAWLERGWLGGRSLSARALTALDALHDIDDRLVAYYREERGRVAASVFAAFLDWWIGVWAIWLALDLLGHPVSFGDALVIEAFLVLVRSTLFFVPADLGTQEGALVLVCTAVAGSGELGLALAVVRRARDILWILWGLAIGSVYSVGRHVTLEAEPDDDEVSEAERLRAAP